MQAIMKNKFFKKYKQQWDNDLKHLILDYQKMIHNAGSVIKHNHLYHPHYSGRVDVAHQGLSELWEKYDDKPFQHLVPPQYTTNDT